MKRSQASKALFIRTRTTVSYKLNLTSISDQMGKPIKIETGVSSQNDSVPIPAMKVVGGRIKPKNLEWNEKKP